jgi:tetratricopeptide (TPR) repeat protein
MRNAGEIERGIARLEADEARARRDGDASVLALLGRLVRARGKDDDRANALLRAAFEMNAHQGRFGDVVIDATALGFFQTQEFRLDEARRTFEDASGAAHQTAEGWARFLYHRAILESAIGDSRAALRDNRECAQRAERIGLHRLHWMARREIDHIVSSYGRTAEALADLVALDASDGAAMNPCDRSDLLNEIGWVALHERAHHEDARTWFKKSLDEYRARCPNHYLPTRIPNALGGLAKADAHSGHIETSKAHLAEAQSLLPHPPMDLALEWLGTRGEIALAERHADEAIAAFDEMAVRAGTIGDTASMEAALEGGAEARVARRDRDGALALLARASELLDRRSASIALGDGRESFVEAHEHTDVRRVDLLVALDRPREALEALRASRARVLAAVESRDRISALSPEQRARWDDAVGAYRRERNAIDAEAADDWGFASDSLTKRREERAARAAQAQAKLDDALAALGPTTSRRRETTDAPGSLILAYLPTDKRWLGFASEDGSTRAVDLGAVDPAASPDALAAALLAPFHAEIARAQRVTVIAAGDARRVDVHALPFDGAPLVAKVPVVYPIDRGATSPPPHGPLVGLVVGDPTSDLGGARAELDGVSTALGAGDWRVTTLRGPAATGASVRGALGGARLFHYSGHGAFAGRDGAESLLPLAEQGALTVTDVLALPHAPRAVVLLGCETARDSGEARAEGLGIAQAFLVAGSSAVVAATRDVRDTTSREIAAGLYAHGAPEADLAGALREAQIAAWKRDVPDWAAFRVLVP